MDQPDRAVALQDVMAHPVPGGDRRRSRPGHAENHLREVRGHTKTPSEPIKQQLIWVFCRRVSKNIPTTKDVEPLLEIDGDVRSFEVFLSSRTPVLAARDIRTFLPCTVNLDPKLREIIAGKTDAAAAAPHHCTYTCCKDLQMFPP